MIVILMATYNGEKYLTEQIESLLAQTMQDFVVYIRDDCSTDDTFRILETYQRNFPDKFVISQNEKNTGNAKYNFIQMMIQYKADYVMLCDQDDVWKPDKIELTFAKMREMEGIYDRSLPLLIHTDLEVVNQQLHLTSESFGKIAHLNPNRTALNQAIVQNVVTGCTVMYNRVLADLLNQGPEDFIMHDWWLLLTASAFGKIGYIPQTTILYRQHSQNSVGAKDTRTLSYRIERLCNVSTLKQIMNATYRQTKSFLCVFEDKLSAQQKQLMQEYSKIATQRKIIRIYRVLKLKVLKHGIACQMAQLFFI